MGTRGDLIENNAVEGTAVNGGDIQKNIIAAGAKFLKNEACEMFTGTAAVRNED